MSKIADSLGMMSKPPSYSIGDTEVVADHSTSVAPVDVSSPMQIDASHEDSRIVSGEKDLDDLIRDGRAAFVELLEKANDAEPRYKARTVEVAGGLMKTVLDAIKHKQDFAHEGKKFKLEAMKHQAPSTSTTQINNIYTDRESIMKMFEEPGAEDE